MPSFSQQRKTRFAIQRKHYTVFSSLIIYCLRCPSFLSEPAGLAEVFSAASEGSCDGFRCTRHLRGRQEESDKKEGEEEEGEEAKEQ